MTSNEQIESRSVFSDVCCILLKSSRPKKPRDANTMEALDEGDGYIVRSEQASELGENKEKERDTSHPYLSIYVNKLQRTNCMLSQVKVASTVTAHILLIKI